MKPIEMNLRRYWQFTGINKLIMGLVGLALCMSTLLIGSPAIAQEFTLHAEPAVAIWLDEPQSDRFTSGFYFAIRPGIALGRIVALQWSYALLMTPAGENFSDDGSAQFLMGGIRLRPLAYLQPEEDQLGGLFMDFNIGYVRTGDEDRFGFDAGLGYGFQFASWFSLGPVVRYAQIVQPNDSVNTNADDAQFLTVGLDFGFGPAHEKDEPAICPECDKYDKCQECEECPKCVQKKAEPLPCECSDRDKDGVCDADDRCPQESGPAATLGCPIDPCSGKPLIVLVQFDYDSSKMPAHKKTDAQTMDPVLDAVANAIAQDPTCNVCIIGHASQEGPDDYNQTLSTQRASAVQNYMTDRGLAKKRIPTIGLGSRCQLVPESTRVLNRRVDFRRLEEGESCPTECSK